MRTMATRNGHLFMQLMVMVMVMVIVTMMEEGSGTHEGMPLSSSSSFSSDLFALPGGLFLNTQKRKRRYSYAPIWCFDGNEEQGHRLRKLVSW
jgi:hypothetical protein